MGISVVCFFTIKLHEHHIQNNLQHLTLSTLFPYRSRFSFLIKTVSLSSSVSCKYEKVDHYIILTMHYAAILKAVKIIFFMK